MALPARPRLGQRASRPQPGPLRDASRPAGSGRVTAIATLLTFVLAIVLAPPLIGLGIEATREGGKMVERLNGIRRTTASEHPTGCRICLSTPGNAAVPSWQANLAEPGSRPRAVRPRGNGSAFSPSRGAPRGSKPGDSTLTILVFTLLTPNPSSAPRWTERSAEAGARHHGPASLARPIGTFGLNGAAAVRGAAARVGVGSAWSRAFCSASPMW